MDQPAIQALTIVFSQFYKVDSYENGEFSTLVTFQGKLVPS